MQSIKQIQRLNQKELDNAVPPSASWHTDYRDTAYIYIGGLPLDLSEGDVITIFSQYGDPVWIKLARDKDSGQSRGFAWLKYEDQRSCDVAVDNLSGTTVMGRLLNVDHARYKMRDDENEADGYVGQDRMLEEEEKHSGRRDRSDSESDGESRRPLIKEEVELAKLLKDQDDDDPMKAYMIDQKKEEVERALQAAKKSSHRDKHRDHDRDRARRKDGDRERHRESRRHAEDGEGTKERRRRRSGSREDRHRRSYRDRSRSPRR